MKRIFSQAILLGASVMLLLSGCTTPEKTSDKLLKKLDDGFTATAKINYKDVKSTLVITSGEEKSYTLTFTEPSSVKDMKLIFTEENVNVSYKGMSFTVAPDDFSDGAVGQMLIDSIKAAAGGENLIISAQNGTIDIKGITDGGEFILKLDEKTGNFLSINFPQNDFYLEFDQFEFF